MELSSLLHSMMVCNGYFGFKDYFKSLCDNIECVHGYFLLGADFTSYLEAQSAADKAFVVQERWTEMSILSTAGSGRFSNDRTIKEKEFKAKTEKLLEDMENKITYLQSALSSLKDGSLLVDERMAHYLPDERFILNARMSIIPFFLLLGSLPVVIGEWQEMFALLQYSIDLSSRLHDPRDFACE
ncbi:hypothetical protein CRYUN_Cryun05aG0189000 [Craigia yunnanensis]